ncbi:MAG: DUF6077 domain-containing protein [Acidobacteriota bacterium]
MPILLILLEAVIAILFAWIAAYAPVALCHLPLKTSYQLVPFTLCLVGIPLLRQWRRRWRSATRRDWVLVKRLAVAAAIPILIVLCTSRPDEDDVSYFYQPQIDHLEPSAPPNLKPFRLPKPSGGWWTSEHLGKIRAYERAVVAAGSSLGIAPIQAYHNLGAALAVSLWLVLYAVVFWQLRLRGPKLWLALAVAVVCLLLDGSFHRSFGNLTLMRIWQGKVITFAILMPMVFLFTLRYLFRPTRRGLWLLSLLLVAAPFINRSALLMAPLVGGTLAIAYLLLAARGARRHRQRAVAVLTVLAMPAALFALSQWGPAGVLQTSWSVLQEPLGQPSTEASSSWYQSLGQRVWNPGLLARDALLLLIVPLVALRAPLGRLIATSQALIALLCFTPVTGPLWYRLLTEPGYWRLYLALCLPLSFGLLAPLLVTAVKATTVRSRLIALPSILLLAIAASWTLGFEHAALAPANGVTWKRPWDLRLPVEALEVAKRFAPRLRGHKALAPRRIAGVLALTEAGTTELAFTTARDRRLRALRATRLLNACRIDPQHLEAFDFYLRRKPDWLIMRCDIDALRRARPRLRLEVVDSYRGYRLVRVEAKTSRNKTSSAETTQ